MHSNQLGSSSFLLILFIIGLLFTLLGRGGGFRHPVADSPGRGLQVGGGGATRVVQA